MCRFKTMSSCLNVGVLVFLVLFLPYLEAHINDGEFNLFLVSCNDENFHHLQEYTIIPVFIKNFRRIIINNNISIKF